VPAYGDVVQVFLPTSRVVDMTSLVLLVVFWTNFYILPRKVDTLQCYECSDFPREPDSQDESLGSCPGWQRKAKYYGLSSLYNACMTVKLKGNGTIIAQNAVIYAQCLEYKMNIPKTLRPFNGAEVQIRCCQESKCNAPKQYRWNQMLAKMDDPRRESIANSSWQQQQQQQQKNPIDNRMQEQDMGEEIGEEGDASTTGLGESYGSTNSRLNSASKEHGLPLLFHLLIASALLLTNEIH